MSWEAGIAHHRVMGYVFLALMAAHAAAWCVFYGEQGTFPRSVWAVADPPGSWPSDFSVPLVSLAATASLATAGLGALNVVRRARFEVFYFAHFSFLPLVLAVLWHAPSAWAYLLPGLLLLCLDHAVRLAHACRPVTVAEFASEGGVVVLRYAMGQGDGHRDGQRDGMQDGSALRCFLGASMGQYVFLNVPAVSLLEWHPFTVSSAPGEPLTSHHVRPMGAGSFTARLEALARDWKSSPAELVVNVEVPSGVPSGALAS